MSWRAMIGVALLVASLKLAAEVFIPIVLSLLIAGALNPVVQLLTKLRLPRVIAVVALMAAILIGVGGGAYLLSDDVGRALSRLPTTLRSLSTLVHREVDSMFGVAKMQRAASEIERAASQFTGSAAASEIPRVQVAEPVRVGQYLWSGSLGLITFAGQVVAVFFLVFFMLLSGDLYKRKLVRLSGPALSDKRITVEVLDAITHSVERYLLVLIASGAMVGVTSYFAFLLLGLSQPAVWALVAGVLNSIPYFGPVVMTALLAVVSLVEFESLSMSLLVTGIALVITSIEGYWLQPYLTSRAAEMNAVAVFVGLLVWGWLWGVPGMFLAVPLMMVLKVICDHVEDWRGVGELLGE